jgi:hypothetical protein
VIFEFPAGPDDVVRAVAGLRLGGPRPVLTIVGGAGRLDDDARERLTDAFAEVIAPAVARNGAVAVDGGTDVGVMRLFGRAHAAHPRFPLIGVLAAGTVEFPGNVPQIDDFARLEPGHTHFVVVPGRDWGDEVPYLPLVAEAVAGGAPRVTMLVDGGDISLSDALLAVERGSPLLVLRGSGRLADRVAAAAEGCDPAGDERIGRLAQSDLVRVVPLDDHAGLADRLDRHLNR